MIRILLADPTARLRSALRMRLELEPDMSVVAEASGTDDLEALVRVATPDVVVADLARDDDSTEDRLRRIAAGGSVRVVGLTLSERRPDARPGIRWVSRYLPDTELLAAVRGA